MNVFNSIKPLVGTQSFCLQAALIFSKIGKQTELKVKEKNTLKPAITT